MIRNHSIILPLEAYQVDNEKRRGRAALVVKVTVVNPPQPRFIHQINILKNLLKDDQIYQVKAVQNDITYKFKENQQHVYINETSGFISLLQNASQIMTSSFTCDIEAMTPVLSVSNEFQGHFKVIERDSRKTPLFPKDMYFVEISNASKRNDHLFKIPITDLNAELALQGIDVKYFDIKENIGKWIILNKNLDPDKTNYSVVIKATSKNGSLMMERDSTEVIFQITDADCHPKIFDKNIYLIDILPEWVEGSSIFNITFPLSGITYNLSGEYTDYFYIDNITGSISLIKQINICQKYELLIFGQKIVPPYYDESAEIILQVSDMNCNVRLFPKDMYLIDMSPDWKEGEIIFNLTSLLPNVKFSLDDVSNLNIDPISGKIIISGPLDTCERHNLTVFGEPANVFYQKGITQVILQPTDQRCYAKLFEKDSYIIEISSNWKEENVILNITISMPAEQLYLLGKDAVHFNITSNGKLYLADKLNICRNYEFLVFGEAIEPIWRNETTQIILQVSDQNCNVRLFPKDTYLIDMLSDWKEGKNIFNVTSPLPDVKFSLEESVSNFNINPVLGEIIISGPLDTCEIQNLIVFGKPANIFYQEGITQVILLPTDQRCHIKLFEKDSYVIDILTEWKENDIILNLTISMPIRELNLLGEEAVHFNITSNGKLYLVNKLDICQNYKFFVFGQASEPVWRNETTQVILQSTDQRCHLKLFEKDSYVIDISSHWKKNDIIFNLTISMPIEVLDLLGDDAVYFNVSSNGKLYLVDKLDICKNYEFFIRGQANEPISRNETTQITLISKDVNCYAEVFEKDSFLIDISSEWKINENIFNLTSSLPDVIYTLKDKTDHFKINATTGQLFLTAELDKCKNYQLSVHGETEGPPPRKGITKLMFISDVCFKKSREFSKCVYAVTIKNEAKGEVVDLRENDESSNVKFEIAEGKYNGLFEIEDDKLILTQKPAEGQYWVKVIQKTDEKLSRSIQRNDNKEVSNREALVIVNAGRQIKFYHPDDWFKLFLPTAPLSDYWFTVRATSIEDELNIQKFSLKFSIKSQNESDFEIDSSTGLVSPRKDVTMVNGYSTSFIVSATDLSNEMAELNVYIYRLRYNNVLKITLKSESVNMANLQNIERDMSDILKYDVHILQYTKALNSEDYELIIGAVKEKQLLTVQELESRMKNETETLQDMFGDFSFAPYTERLIKKDIDDEPRVDPFLVSTIILACLSAILCILILIFIIAPKFRNRKHSLSSEESEEYEKSNNISFHMAEYEESHFKNDTAQSPNVNQLENVIESEVDQLESSTIFPLEKGETNTEDTSSNEPVPQDCQNDGDLMENEISKYESEKIKTDVNHFSEENIQQQSNDFIEETNQDNIGLLKSAKVDNQAYNNEAFEDTSVHLNAEDEINCTDCNDLTNELNELGEKTATNDASPEINKKKISVKFNDTAILIP